MKTKIDTTKYFEIIDDGKTSTSKMMDNFKKKFNTYCYWDDLDKNFPAPKKETTRYFLKQQDPDIKNVSYNDLKKDKKEFMTFREYLLAFEQYHGETGKYLDEVGWTIFSDAGLPDGLVAYGHWDPGYSQSRFGWYYPGLCDPHMGARLAIPNPSSLNLVSLNLEKRVEKIESWIRKEANFINPFD